MSVGIAKPLTLEDFLRRRLPGFLPRGQFLERIRPIAQIASPCQRDGHNQAQTQRHFAQAERIALLEQQRTDKIDLLAHGVVSSIRKAAPMAWKQ